MKYVHVTTGVLNVKKNVLSPKRQHTVAMFSGSEEYSSLKDAVAQLTKEIKDLKANGLHIGACYYEFDFFFGADWKFIAAVYGLSGPASKV